VTSGDEHDDEGGAGAPPYRRGEAARIAWLALGAILVVALAWLGATDVVRMEGLVAEGAREMARTGSWAVPRIHGEVYAYKPPLAYVLARLSFALVGEGELALRLPFALCAVALALVVFAGVARWCGPRAAGLAALAATTGFLFVQKARSAEFDAPLAAFLGMAQVAACVNLLSPRPRTWLWLASYAALAAAFLTKGPIAFALHLPGLVLAAWSAGRARRLLARAHVGAALGCLVVVLGWLRIALGEAGEAVLAQPRAEASLRALDWDLAALARTPLKPLAALGLFFPWSPFVLLAASPELRASLAAPARALLRAALAFAAGAMLALMALPTYEPRYFLPLATPLGIAAGILLAAAGRSDRRLARRATRAAAVVAVLMGVALVVTGARRQIFAPPGRPLAVLGGLALATLAWRARRGAPRPLPLVVLGIAAAGWLVQARWIEPRQARSRSLRAVGEAFAALVPEDATVWTAGRDEHSSLFFYLDRPVAWAGPGLERAPSGAWLVLAPLREEVAGLRAAPGLSLTLELEEHGRSFVLGRKRAP